MPILLEPPAYRPGGPDGKGWNRLSLNAHMGTSGPQCALRPRSYPALWTTARSTRHAEWGGGYGACTGGGTCTTCPRLNPEPRPLETSDDRVLVRLNESDADRGWTGAPPARPVVMTSPDGEAWTWEQLTALQGWRVGRAYRDEHGEGFWLIREVPDARP